MLDTLKSLALKWTSDSGHLFLWMLPFTSYRATVIYDDFSVTVPKEDWKSLHYTFVNFYAFILNVEVSQAASPIERVFGILWEHRDDELLARWELFQQLYSPDLLHGFNIAYDATRDHTFALPVPTKPAEDADPQLLRSTTQPEATS